LGQAAQIPRHGGHHSGGIGQVAVMAAELVAAMILEPVAVMLAESLAAMLRNTQP
jgi:hypothetical protein